MKKLLALFILTIGLFANSINVNAAKMDSKSYSLMVGETVKINVTETSKTIKWNSEDKKIATVDKNGNVTAKKVGKTKINATVGKETLECNISVSKPQKAISIVKYQHSKDGVTASYVTSGKYDNIKKDMKYEDVVKLIGADGSVLTQVGDETTESNMSIYVWYGEDGISNACVSFKDGIVQEKSQILLK